MIRTFMLKLSPNNQERHAVEALWSLSCFMSTSTRSCFPNPNPPTSWTLQDASSLRNYATYLSLCWQWACSLCRFPLTSPSAQPQNQPNTSWPSLANGPAQPFRNSTLSTAPLHSGPTLLVSPQQGGSVAVSSICARLFWVLRACWDENHVPSERRQTKPLRDNNLGVVSVHVLTSWLVKERKDGQVSFLGS